MALGVKFVWRSLLAILLLGLAPPISSQAAAFAEEAAVTAATILQVKDGLSSFAIVGVWPVSACNACSG